MLKRKLLLADDSITIQKVVNLTFADEGIEVISVGDGDAAMQKIGEYAPDLILADVNMPGLNGYQICERIKQSPETEKIPVILLVGSFEPFDESEAYRVGADDYLTKPFQSIRQLVTKVSDLLEAAATEGKAPAAEAVVEAEPETANVHFFNTVEATTQTPIETTQFDDASYDDEMIQTSQIGSLPTDEIQKFIADSMPESSNAAAASASLNSDFDFYRTVEAEEDFGKTTPLDISDLRTFSGENVEGANAAAVYEIVSEENANEEYPEINASAQDDADQYSIQNSDRIEIESGEINQSRLRQTDFEKEVFLSSQTAPQTTVSAEQPSVGAPDFSFDDFDLLDLPPIESSDEDANEKPRFDWLTDSHPEDAAEPTEKVESSVGFESYRDDSAEQRSEAEKLVENKANTADETEAQTDIDRQIAALSPAVIEAIARRVAETMSDKAIREIAWEVVPQMTDLIVRRMAEEKLKE